MTETLSSEELVIGQQIRALADAGVPVRDPSVVVRAVVSRQARRSLMRPPLGLLASAMALVLVAVISVASLSQMGGRATVGGISIGGINLGGTTYDISVARSIDLSGARLTAVDEAHQYTGGFRTDGSTVYRVDDVDPRQVLVMKLVPGEADDAGSVGDYLVLVRGNGFSLLCPYWQEGDPLAPSECR